MVTLNESRNDLFDKAGLRRLKDSYMRPDESSPQQRFAYVATSFSGGDDELAQCLYDYMSKHWLSPSSPQLSFGRNKQGMPIACFLPYIPDTTRGLIETWAEVSELSVVGGGIGIGVGIRQSGKKSVGIMPHLKTYDASCTAYKQGQTRRGSYAVYLDVSHPEIKQFLNIRRVGGDDNYKTMNIHNAVNLPDAFMKKIWLVSALEPILKCDDPEEKRRASLVKTIVSITSSDKWVEWLGGETSAALKNLSLENTREFIDRINAWDLIDPHTGLAVQTVKAAELWQMILTARAETGEPFLHFIDESNRKMPQCQKDLGLTIKQSNLCSEITLPTDADRTAVCCLASLNLDYFDEWCDDEKFYLSVCVYLDNVLQYFIDHAPPTLKRAIHSARSERAIGVGALGFHSYLQSKNIAIESMAAYHLTNKIFRKISTHLNNANLVLGKTRGEAPDCVGTGKRFSHVTAIAPNATSSIIMGNTSPSCEPFRANVYKQDTLSGSHVVYNKHLVKLLKSKTSSDAELKKLYDSVRMANGSVQNLKVLSDHEKQVFKTWPEINQSFLIKLAAARQRYVDQSQSTSLFFNPDESKNVVHKVHLQAWLSNLKTLYYFRSTKILTVDKINRKNDLDLEKSREEQEECVFCEG